MDNIYPLNALILVFLGFYTWRQRRDGLSFLLLVSNLALAGWNLCAYLLADHLEAIDVNLVSQFQLGAALIFTNGFYSFSQYYPRAENHIRLSPLNLGLVFVFLLLIGFTDFVSQAVLEGGSLVFIDGPGYQVYSLYLVVLGVLSLVNLIRSYRQYPAYRARVGYMLTGMALFFVLAIIFDLVLPLLGNYDLLHIGHLSSLFPPLFFAYAVTKHELLNVSITVKRNTARLLVSAVTIVSFYFAWELMTEENDGVAVSRSWLSLLIICSLGVFWGQFSQPLEQFLVTTARRKFVRGWYDAEDILNRLGGKLELEKNRLDIFRNVVAELDRTFELEMLHYVVAIRDENDQHIGYSLFEATGHKALRSLPVDHYFIEACRQKQEIATAVEFSEKVQNALMRLGHRRLGGCLVIPVSSPEILEGILILGERSSEDAFSNKDRLFFRRLVSYVSAILYRLTPFEKLERQYVENQRKLHEAEIQLIRAEKIQAIAHATRQAHHEIRTPLNIIRLGARRIRDMESAEKYKAITEDQVQRAMEIIDETLAITDAGGENAQRPVPVDIEHILHRCLKLLPESSHEVELELQPDLPRINAVPGEMQVLFTNLMKNALEAMPLTGKLTVRAFLEGDQLVVAVSDTGSGIEDEIRERIWEPYFSGKVTSAGNQTAGRGWGLTISNRIITDHKGTIQLSSKPGEGATFTIRLPAPPAVEVSSCP